MMLDRMFCEPNKIADRFFISDYSVARNKEVTNYLERELIFILT